MRSIKYIEKKTKYQLMEQYKAMTGIIGYTVDYHLIKLYPIGQLVISPPYAWDGPSGPTIDTKSAIRGSLEHDAFFELLRNSLIPMKEISLINSRLEVVCKEDGMFNFRAEIWNILLDNFGYFAADPENKPEVLTAP